MDKRQNHRERNGQTNQNIGTAQQPSPPWFKSSPCQQSLAIVFCGKLKCYLQGAGIITIGKELATTR